MHKIQRKKELDKLSVLKDRDLIKVITGVRRCGKSTLLLQFQLLITMDYDRVSHNGVKQINAIDWLLGVSDK